MKRNHVYHFGSFTLNSLSRELNRNSEPVVLAASAFDCLVYLIEHRERPVGKDELISAVWARSDVSENLVAQTIVRLRRTIDDVDSEQSCIKTVVRVGYRWMLDTSVAPQAEAAAVVETPSNESSDFVVPAGSERIVHYSMVRRALRSPITIFFLLTFAIGVAYFYPHANRVNTTHKEMHFEGKTAIVLPVKVDAPDEWKWLSFGLMDMISSQLRQAKVPTENSQSVVNLLNQPVADSGDWRASFALVISPNASLINAAWHVHLDARGKDGKSWQAEASATDVLSATRTASDLLLAEIGFSSQVKEVALSANSIEEYLLRIEAAQLANASDLAHALIDKAPSDVRRSPEFAYTEGLFNCNENKVAPCEQILSGLLKQLTAADEPLLRAKVLTVFWYIDYHKHLLTDGLAALDEAVRLLLGQKDTEALANAYLARSHIEYYQSRLDDSAAERARKLYFGR
jgi:DNA-binding winged helix-turn-helix (wHTH) protein